MPISRPPSATGRWRIRRSVISPSADNMGVAGSAVIAGDMIYLSGIVAGQGPGETDLVPAYDRVFRQIGAALKRVGASLDDVVDMTTYHTDITAQIDTFAQVKKRHLTGLPPAWTAIDVDRLLPDAGLTEVKVVAHRRGAAVAK